MKKANFAKRSFDGPYPEPHTIDGISKKMPPNGEHQPEHDGGHPPKITSHPIGAAYPAGQDFGPYIDCRGEGLYHSFTLDFENPIPFNSGGIHPHTGLLLFSLALNIRPDVIIETGTYYGSSTFFLAKVCEIWGQGKVYTIDPEMKHVHPTLLANPYIEFIEERSEKALPTLLERVAPVDFAFLDSWKRLAYVEFLLIDDCLAEGGIVAFHDTQNLNSGHTLYEMIKDRFPAYDKMLFTGLPHTDNPHHFHGNADDRGLYILRKRHADPFLHVADADTAYFKDAQVCPHVLRGPMQSKLERMNARL